MSRDMIFCSNHCQNCWRMCRHTFAETCISCTTGLQHTLACTNENIWTLFSPAWWSSFLACSLTRPKSPLPFRLETSQMSPLRDSSRARRWSTAQDAGSMWKLTTDTRYFRANATVNGASLLVAHWRRWSSIWTAAVVVAVLMLKCPIIILCQCNLYTIPMSSIKYVRVLQSGFETSFLPLKKALPAVPCYLR
jgi:hypothetical protein